MDNSWHLAIDFGTSNSAAAHTSPLSGSVEALSLSHRSHLMPSAVFADPAGTLLTGDTALSRGRRDPSRLTLSPKRFIDHDFIQLAGQDIPLADVVGAVLASILERGRAQHGDQAPASVTLTHPEQWSVHAIDALQDAARKAGVDGAGLRTISEPRAAAVHYASQQSVTEGGHVAVFDFGGGTLDIAVLRAGADGDFQVVAAKGDNSLGGRSIDNLLYRWVLDQVEQDDPDLSDYLRRAPISVMHSLEENIRDAKEILSDTSSASITVSTPTGEHDLLITRDEFNNVIDRPVQRACELTQAALEQAGVDTTDTPIYMTGGSSRIPHMQNRLAEVGRVMTLDDPKTVVSRGALAATLLGFTAGSAPQSGSSTPAPNAETAGNPFAAGSGAGAAPQSGGSTPAPNAETAGNPFAAGAGAGAAGAAGAAETSAFEKPAQSQPSQPAQPPATPPAPPRENTRPAAAASSIPSSHSSTSTDTKKSPLLPIALGVGALVLVGGGILAFMNMSGNDSGGDTTEATTQQAAAGTTTGGTTAPATSAAAAAPTASAAAPAAGNVNDTSYVPLTEFYPAAQVLPQQAQSSLESCRVGTRAPQLTGPLRDIEMQTHSCNLKNTDGHPAGNDLAYGAMDVVTGPDARSAMEAIAAVTDRVAENTAIQDASGDTPEVRMVVPQSGLTGTAVFYPEQELLLLTTNGAGVKSADEVTAWAQFFGFM